MDILTEFDELQEALKKVRIDEDVMIYRNGMLVENQDACIKIQKLLNSAQMADCHPFLYDCDLENLTPVELDKIDKLYNLAVNRKYVDDSFNAELAAEEAAEAKPVVDVTPAPVQPKKNYIPCWTVLYSATDGNGNAKCGECYSNAISPAAAKADVLAKLARFNYGNVAILAIEAGDPDMVGREEECVDCQDAAPAEEQTKQPIADLDTDSTIFEAAKAEKTDDIAECDPIKGRPHNAHKSTGNISETVEDSLTTDEFTGKSGVTLNDVASLFEGCCDEDDTSCPMLSEEEFEECCRAGVAAATRIPDDDFFNIPMNEEDDDGQAEAPAEQPAEQPAETSEPAADQAEAPAEQPAETSEPAPEQSAETSDDTSADQTGTADEQPTETTDDSGDGSAEEQPAETSDDSSDETTDDAGDDGEAEEDTEDSDAESADDSDDDADDESDDSSSDEDGDEELSDEEKSQLKDKYSTIFKNAMTKLEFKGKSFFQLKDDEKVKVLKKVEDLKDESGEWSEKNPATSKYMTDKQISQLYSTVTPNPED